MAAVRNPHFSIGKKNESGLHAALKNALAREGDRLEEAVDGFVIDILRPDLLLEIQTRNFSSISRKLRTLLADHKIRLVHPIAWESVIVYVDEAGKEISRRKSPKKGKAEDCFRELIRIPDLPSHPNFALHIAMIRQEEIRRDDGQGSWRRKGVSIINRRLVEISEIIALEAPSDFLQFLPEDLPSPFTNNDLARLSGRSKYDARKTSYCLKKMGLIQDVGRQGNAILHELVVS